MWKAMWKVDKNDLKYDLKLTIFSLYISEIYASLLFILSKRFMCSEDFFGKDFVSSLAIWNLWYFLQCCVIQNLSQMQLLYSPPLSSSFEIAILY